MCLNNPARALTETKMLYIDGQRNGQTDGHMDRQTGCFQYTTENIRFAGVIQRTLKLWTKREKSQVFTTLVTLIDVIQLVAIAAPKESFYFGPFRTHE